MKENNEQPGAPVVPGMIAVDPRVVMEEMAALSDFWRNRNMAYAQAAFAERQKNAELGEAINLVQENTSKVVAENEVLRTELEKLKAKPAKAKTVN